MADFTDASPVADDEIESAPIGRAFDALKIAQDDILTNAANIAANSSSIATTSSQTATNTAAIATNATIAANTATTNRGRPALLSRLILSGHSYLGYDNASPYGSTNPQNSQARDQSQHSALVRDALVPNARQFIEKGVPAVAAGSDATTFLGMIPEDCVIEGIWFIPNTSATGDDTESRTHEAQFVTVFGNTTFSYRKYATGVNMVSGTPQYMYWLGKTQFGLNGSDNRITTSAGVATTNLWFSSQIAPSGTAARLSPLFWKSTHVGGTGLADPGGTVVVRLGGRFRNLAIPGCSLIEGGIYNGGWGTLLSTHRKPEAFGVEVSTTTVANAAATSIAVDAMTWPIVSGAKVTFNNGVTATLTSGVTVGDSALTVSALSGGVPANSHGFLTTGATGGTVDGYVPEAIWLFEHGLNDASNFPDRTAWREVVRFSIALASCPYMHNGRSNSVYTNGSGTWAAFVQPAGGQWIPPVAGTSGKRFTGTATGASRTTKLANFPGGTLDLFYAALCGATRGVQVSIAVNGGTPVILDTSGVTATAGVTTLSVSSATSTTVTGTGFTNNLIGKIIEKSDIPKGTMVSTVNAAGTSMTISAAATGTSTSTATFVSYVPMVKRVTSLAAGSLSVVETITGIDATDGSAALIPLGIGYEVDTPVMWCNIARLPSGLADAVIQNFNTDSAAVIAGTAAAVGTGTQEPALPSTVQLVDTNAALAVDANNICPDGVHPNSRGHRIVAELLIRSINTALSNLNALAR